MNDLESTVQGERRKGYFPTLIACREGWTCSLECGIDVLPGYLPRPRGGGMTAMAALVDACRDRDRIVASVKRVA